MSSSRGAQRLGPRSLRATRLGALALAMTALGRVVVACIIDLDPPSGASADAGLDDAETSPGFPDVGAGDGGAGIECTKAVDCDAGPFGASCLSPRCSAGTCVYDLCPTADPCSIARCDLQAGTGRCEPPTAQTFQAGSFSVSTGLPFAALPCGTLNRCVATTSRFVFVADGQDTVSGYLVADPGETTPRRVAVDRLPVAAAAVMASGERVYFIGAPAGPLQNMRLTIGWFHAPRNPFSGVVAVSHVVVGFRAGAAAVPTLMPAPDDGLYLSTGRETYVFHPPTGPANEITLVKPLPDNATVTLAAPAGSQIAAFGIDASTSGTSFALLQNAGTPTAGFSGAQPTASVGTLAGGQIFVGGGPSGEVVAASAVGTADGGPVTQVQKARLTWIVEPGGSAITASAAVDLESYPGSPPASTRVIGPTIGVDGGALTLRANPARTASIAQLVERDDGTGLPALHPTRMAFVPTTVPQTFVMQGAADRAYLLSSSAATLTVYVFKPSCDP